MEGRLGGRITDLCDTENAEDQHEIAFSGIIHWCKNTKEGMDDVGKS
jgi:hypothetical protein